MWRGELSSECGASCLLNGASCLPNVGRDVLGRVFFGASCLGASCLLGELSVIRYRHDSRADKNPYRHDRRADSLSPSGQRHVILSPIDAHYKWPQNKIYSHVS